MALKISRAKAARRRRAARRGRPAGQARPRRQPRRSTTPELASSHGHGHAALGHAAMIGDQAPALGGPAISTRFSIRRRRSRTARAGARVRPDGGRPEHRGRARRPLPGVDVQRHGAGARDPRDRGRPAARALRQRRLASAHDPLPRHPPGEHGRRLRGRPAGRSRSRTSSRRGRPGCSSTTATRRR